MADTWTIAPLALGSAVRDLSQTLLGREHGTELRGVILAWLLMDRGRRILVDTGAFGPVERPDVSTRYERTPEQTLECQLGRFGVTPDKIDLVINTHLHLDHAGGNGWFPGIGCVVQRMELEYARDPLPVHRGAYDLDFSGIAFEQLDGDAEIAPGIRVILTPGHSPGGQAVLVDTDQGLHVLAGDTITHYMNMDIPTGESFWPNAMYVDLGEFYRSLDRLRDLGGVILPGHDPLVLKQPMYP